MTFLFFARSKTITTWKIVENTKKTRIVINYILWSNHLKNVIRFKVGILWSRHQMLTTKKPGRSLQLLWTDFVSFCSSLYVVRVSVCSFITFKYKCDGLCKSSNDYWRSLRAKIQFIMKLNSWNMIIYWLFNHDSNNRQQSFCVKIDSEFFQFMF